MVRQSAFSVAVVIGLSGRRPRSQRPQAPAESWGEKVGPSVFDDEAVLGRYDRHLDYFVDDWHWRVYLLGTTAPPSQEEQEGAEEEGSEEESDSNEESDDYVEDRRGPASRHLSGDIRRFSLAPGVPTQKDVEVAVVEVAQAQVMAGVWWDSLDSRMLSAMASVSYEVFLSIEWTNARFEDGRDHWHGDPGTGG